MGSTSGLAQEFQKIAELNSDAEILKISRSIDPAKYDFTKRDLWERLVADFEKLNPTRIFYFAGGGPYGAFAKKEFKDHQWAWRLNFEFPCFLIHQLANSSHSGESFSLKQFIYVGSAVAENGDAFAASYAAGKVAMKGLAQSLIAEDSLPFELKIFSPGYINTKMLPANAWPRQQAGLVQEPQKVAMQLWMFFQNTGDT